MKNDTLKSCVLKNIRYESSGGSMNYHSEFEIEASADEIARTAYWGGYYFGTEESSEREKLTDIDNSFRTSAPDDMIVREHIPMDKKLWTALTEEMEYLKEQLKPVEKIRLPIKPDPDMFVLDGGDYQRLYLTWHIDGDEQTEQYYCPSGNRWYSVMTILHEMSRPIGRDLRRIGETVMTEFYLDTPKYSYQITPIKNSDEYYFFVHGDESDKSKVTYDEWLIVRDFLGRLDVSEFKSGKHKEKFYLRLNYNNGINKNMKINKETSEQIREYIRKTIIGQ